MAKRKHSVANRLWEQTRNTKHLCEWFEIWDVLSSGPGMGWQYSKRVPLDQIKHSLHSMMIVRLALINDRRGNNLRGLIRAAEEEQIITEAEREGYESELQSVSASLENIVGRRHHLVAHRSQTMAGVHIKERFPVEREDLMRCIDIYRHISVDLFSKTNGFRSANGDHVTQAWPLDDKVREQAEAMMAALIEPRPPS